MTSNIDQIGNLKLIQSPSGVKASVDSILLARFIRPSPGWRVADLGCGNGLVGLLLAKENPHCRLLGIEIQSELGGQETWEAALVRTEGAIDETARQLHVIAQIDDPFGPGSEGRAPIKIGQVWKFVLWTTGSSAPVILRM